MTALNRLQKKTADRASLIHLTHELACSGHRYPRPAPALDVAVSLGLVKSSGSVLSLAPLGKVFVEKAPPQAAELSSFQRELLLGLLLDDQHVKQHVNLLMQCFHTSPKGILQMRPATISSNQQQQLVSRVLQQLGVVTFDGGVLSLSPGFDAKLSPDVAESIHLTEEELWNRLDKQRLRARRVEEFIVLEERRRLSKRGRQDLAEMVTRISARDVSAGYDILSFELDGSPRLIEVKSSIGTQVRFAWSLRERYVAENNRSQYWVYFVPMAHSIPSLPCPVLLIRDPVGAVRSNLLRESPSGYFVTADQKIDTSNIQPASPMVEWRDPLGKLD